MCRRWEIRSCAEERGRVGESDRGCSDERVIQVE